MQPPTPSFPYTVALLHIEPPGEVICGEDTKHCSAISGHFSCKSLSPTSSIFGKATVLLFSAEMCKALAMTCWRYFELKRTRWAHLTTKLQDIAKASAHQEKEDCWASSLLEQLWGSTIIIFEDA
jgi:hypothetical protein